MRSFIAHSLVMLDTLTLARTLPGPTVTLVLSQTCTLQAFYLFLHPQTRHVSNRVFILGPSHKKYLEKCALTPCISYVTPLGNIPIDREGMLFEYPLTGRLREERMSFVL